MSFLTTLALLSISRTTPVAAILKPAPISDTVCTASSPVPWGVTGAQMCASQCRCSGVYLIMRCRMLCSVMARMGRVWKRRQPRETISGSLFFRILGYHL